MNILKFLLFPLGIIYFIVTFLRNFFYDIKLFKSHSFNVPVVGVGNISSGGTGKTPFVEYLINKYSKNYNSVLISRGYKRSSKGFQKANLSSTPRSIGDEPFQIFKKFKNIEVAVDKNRVNAISKIITDNPKTNLVLLDDSFQHRKVKLKLNILLTTFSNPFYNDHIIPVGSLRESKYSYKRADIIIVSKTPEKTSKEKLNEIRNKINIYSNQRLFFTYVSYESNLKGDYNKSIDSLKNKKVFLVTGIANSSNFIDFFRKNEIDYKHFSFSDHHKYSQADINKIEGLGKNLVLTTEKDFQKIQFLQRKNQWSFLEIKTKFVEDELEFDNFFRKKISM